MELWPHTETLPFAPKSNDSGASSASTFRTARLHRCQPLVAGRRASSNGATRSGNGKRGMLRPAPSGPAPRADLILLIVSELTVPLDQNKAVLIWRLARAGQSCGGWRVF